MPDAILCLRCGFAEHLTRRRWYLGRKECWWCEYCLAVAIVLSVQGTDLGVTSYERVA